MNIDFYDNLLKKINIKLLDCYLKQNGWKRDYSFSNNKNLLFTKSFDDIDNAEIVIPAKEYYKDFIPKVKDVIEAISVYENKNIDLVLNEIVTLDIDRLEIRIISDISQKGSLPLKYASDVVNGLKDLIISSACNEENPRPLYDRVTKSAKGYAELFKFGQTAPGSFIMTIESEEFNEVCPQMLITDDCEIKESKIEIPFQRKVFRRVQKALYQVSNIGNQGDIDQFIENAFKEGINANMCDAILFMKDEKHPITIESSFYWSELYPEGNEIPNKLSINQNNFPFIQAIRDAYRDRQLLKDMEIIGSIKGIFKADGTKVVELNELCGYVTIDFLYENKPRTVKVYLEGEPFKLACDALKETKQISVFGTLDMSTKFWHLNYPVNFKFL
jgi:hypothetical protein